jgi:hypothetical protein
MDQVFKTATASDVWVLQGEADITCDIVGSSSSPDCEEEHKCVPLQKGFLITRTACMEYVRGGRYDR